MLTCRVPGMLSEFAALPDVERLMGSFLAPGVFAGAPQRGTFPALNVWEDTQALKIEAELPGYSLDQLDITALGDELTIAGTRESTLPEGATVHRHERAPGSTEFKRTLRVGIPFDADKVSATLEQGVLTITLPKAEQAKPRKIAVKSS